VLACALPTLGQASRKLAPIAQLKIPNHEATMPAKKFHDYVAKRWVAMKESLGKIDKAKTHLIFVGDSITDAWGRNRDSWNKYYGAYGAQNFAIGADTTHGVLRRIAEGNVDGFSPRAVVMLIGVNNIAWGPKHNVQQTAEGILKVVQTLHQKLPKTKILIVGLLPRGARSRDQSFRWQKGIEVNSIVERYADNDRVFYIDVGEHLLEETGVPKKGHFGDGVHLSKQGLDVWAQAMDLKLKEIMHGKRDRLDPIDFQVRLKHTAKGQRANVELTVKADKTLPTGSRLDFILPAGFYLDRSATKLAGADAKSATLSVLSPVATITLSKSILKGKPARFALTNVTSPTFATTTASFTLEARNKAGQIKALGTYRGVNIR
jgi:lysophospholipase L1-like esterase